MFLVRSKLFLVKFIAEIWPKVRQHFSAKRLLIIVIVHSLPNFLVSLNSGFIDNLLHCLLWSGYILQKNMIGFKTQRTLNTGGPSKTGCFLLIRRERFKNQALSLFVLVEKKTEPMGLFFKISVWFKRFFVEIVGCDRLNAFRIGKTEEKRNFHFCSQSDAFKSNFSKKGIASQKKLVIGR